MSPVPFNDTQRLNRLAAYDILDSPKEEAFDCLTRLACRHFKTPIAMVSLVDDGRQWFKSIQGLDARETDRKSAFCGYTILSDDPMVVFDATRDPRFAANELVRGSPNIRFYAGAPLITRSGFRIGTFCIIDVAVRDEFTEEDIAALKDFAAAAMQNLELQRNQGSNDGQDQEESDDEKAHVELFSTVAHEIRSPVAALCSSAKILESQIFGPPGDERYLEFFTMMSETAEHVVNLTDRMLDFTQLKTGDVATQEEPVVVRDLLEKAKRLAQIENCTKEYCLQVMDVRDDIVVKADATFLGQMLHNLIANALKYNHADPVVELSAQVSDTGVLEISVSDSGIGMSEDGIRLALQPYTQIKQTGRKFAGGVGIGLPLVKRLVEMHGGRLAIASTKGKGTKVSLLLPSDSREHHNAALA